MTIEFSPLSNCPDCGYNLKGLPSDHRCPECGFAYTNGDRIIFGNNRGILFFSSLFCFVLALCQVVAASTNAMGGETSGHVARGILVRTILQFLNRDNSWATDGIVARIFASIIAVTSFCVGTVLFIKSRKRSHVLVREHEIRWQQGSLKPVVIPWILVCKVEKTVRLNPEKRKLDASCSLDIVLHLADGTEKYIPEFCYTSDETTEELFCLITQRLKNNHIT